MSYDIKQVILVRTDLKMRRGKECAQVAHASMAATLRNLSEFIVLEWCRGAFAKIVLSVDSEEELLAVETKAREAGLITALIKDAGMTEFAGVPTLTTCAIGPARSADFVGVTDHLRLR